MERSASARCLSVEETDGIDGGASAQCVVLVVDWAGGAHSIERVRGGGAAMREERSGVERKGEDTHTGRKQHRDGSLTLKGA